MDERLQGAPWYTIEDVAYGVPYQWGADVLMYNTDVFPEPPTSWGTIYEEQDLPDGRVQLRPHPAVRRPDLTSPPPRCT